MSTVKSRKNIPVMIVEDHHEVVPHIHRDIASKHLPFSDVRLVHFDSHPDMLIPVDMKADTVFDKTTLYETLSIENWIVPLVYAGHISYVYWLKPPWCEQIVDGVYSFYVGRCFNTGTIRTTCKESYFVSETLYVDESLLENKKLLTLHVMTVIPENWNQLRDQSPSTDKSQSQVISLDGKADVTDPGLNQTKRRKTDETQNDNLKDELDKDISRNESITEEISKDKSPAISKDNALKKGKADNATKTACRKSFFSQLDKLAMNLEHKHYILDIDLDFYSTKNPFREMYTTEQMTWLKQLYKYIGPGDNGDQAIKKCVEERTKQLQEVKSAILLLSEDSEAAVNINEERLEVLKKLISSLKSEDPRTDFELLHEAGCTMDDTELPHHVSSEKQICSLVQETKHILEALPSPSLITLSRSSVDDYCPPDQVDYIEEAVTLALEEVCVYTEVHRLYTETVDSAEDTPSTSTH